MNQARLLIVTIALLVVASFTPAAAEEFYSFQALKDACGKAKFPAIGDLFDCQRRTDSMKQKYDRGATTTVPEERAELQNQLNQEFNEFFRLYRAVALSANARNR